MGRDFFSVPTDNPRRRAAGHVAGRDFFHPLTITRVFGLLKKVLQGGFLRKDIQGSFVIEHRTKNVKRISCVWLPDLRAGAPPPRLKISKAVSQSGIARKT